MDGLNPMRAWHRGVTSVILSKPELREDELQQNSLLSQLYKLEKNSVQLREYIMRTLCGQFIYQNPESRIPTIALENFLNSWLTSQESFFYNSKGVLWNIIATNKVALLLQLLKKYAYRSQITSATYTGGLSRYTTFYHP